MSDESEDEAWGDGRGVPEVVYIPSGLRISLSLDVFVMSAGSSMEHSPIMTKQYVVPDNVTQYVSTPQSTIRKVNSEKALEMPSTDEKHS